MVTKSEIRLVRDLADKRTRDAEGLFVAEGEKLIGEMLRSDLRIRTVYALEGVFAAERRRAPEALFREVSPAEMARLSHLKTAGRALAVVEIPHRPLNRQTLGEELVLALDEVQNPGNLGTIIRLADWYGIGDIICSPATADCFNPKVVQATMGAILRVRVHYTPLAPFLREAAGRGLPVYGTFLEGDDIYRTELTPAGVLVMGNEGRGVTPAVAAASTRKLFSPPSPAGRRTTESLNVAMATGIVCSEFRRRM